MAASDKDTIYIDIDDEITGIIDKVKASNGKIVALVLPKRASVFQSIVNMKLLKRAADADKKNLVLITAEAGLLPLAGAAGVHVAKTLTSKPEIPTGPDSFDDDEDATDELAQDEPEPDPKKPVGELAAAGAAGAAIGAKSKDNDLETLDLDNEDIAPAAATGAAKKAAGPKKDKKLKVPDFDRFRLMLIAGGLALILLIIGFIVANSVLPSATILIKTNASSVNVSLPINLSTDAKTLNEKDNTVPAKLSSTQKTYTQQVPATGQKNNGNKASGDVTVTNCSKSDQDITIPAGTGLSSGGNTYISQQTVTVPHSFFSGGGNCIKNGKASVSVIAQSGGASYNLSSGASFSVSTGGGALTGQGGSITGGTDDIVKIVTQNDINNAKSKITPNEDEVKKTLNDQIVKENLYPMTATYSAGTPAVTTSPNAGDVADNVTVTENVTYTMFGVKKDDINTLLDNAIKDQVDSNKQTILDNGLSRITYNVENLTPTSAKMTGSTTAYVGPDLDTAVITREAAGQKPGAVKDKLRTNPDVTDVQVKLSPFWVSSVPTKESKIKVIIAKPANNSNSSDASN
jgi:hypothetical protein